MPANLCSLVNSFSRSSFSLSYCWEPGNFSVARANLYFSLFSYSFLIASTVAYLRYFFSLSISASEVLFKCFGTGLALTSRLIASGNGIIFGFGFVRLNGSGTVTSLTYCSSSWTPLTAVWLRVEPLSLMPIWLLVRSSPVSLKAA